MNKNQLRTALLLLAACTSAFGDVLVVPNAQATAVGTASINNSGSATRIQEVVGGGQFPGPITITALHVRTVPGTGSANLVTSAAWIIAFSTTQAYPNTNNGHTLPSTTYANNIGPDVEVVYSGPTSTSSPGCQQPGPCPFDLILPLTTPFHFDPSQGRLLIDLNIAAVPGNTGTLDAVQFADSTSSTVAVVSGNPSLPSGNLSLGGLVFGLETSTSTYYVPHLAFGGGWQSTLTYVNYSPLAVSCQTSFFNDSGTPQLVPFGGTPVSTRTDNLAPGASLHQQTAADLAAAATTGWAVVVCSYPIKASVLFRNYNQAVAQGEAGVNASTTPTTAFVTFAETKTGIAYANPSSTTTANVTITALNAAGLSVGSTVFAVAPNGHGSANIGPLLGLNNFTGSVQITSTAPIVSLSLNAEAFPVFSGLPPGDLPTGTPLAPGH
jgi:hypothetical protein